MAPPLTKDMARFDFHAGRRPHPQLGARHEPLAGGVVRAGRQAHQGTGKPPGRKPAARSPGTVLALKPLTIAAENGAVALLTVTPEGGKPMAGTAWAAGRRLKAGDSL